MVQRIQHRRDTTADWQAANPVLASGEFGIELDNTTGAVVGVRLGDGVTAWNALDRYATMADVQAAVAALVDGAPGLLDTLNELAAALGDDPNFITTLADQQAATDERVRKSTMAVVRHGLNPAVARPEDAPATYWIGDTEPLLARSEDLVRLEKNLLTGDDLLLKEAVALWDARTHDGGPLLKDLSGRGHHLQMGSTHVARMMGEEGLLLPGQSGKYASAPDRAEYDITGDIDLVFDGALNSWVPGTQQTLLSKENGGTTRTLWLNVLPTSGKFALNLSPDGTAFVTATSSISPTVGPGERLAVRVTWRQSDGKVQFFTAPTSDGPWTQLGDDQTAAVASLFVSTSEIAVGARVIGNTTPASGFVYRAIVKDGINGTPVFDADFTKYPEGTTSFAEDALGATVTINGTTGADTNDPLFLSLDEDEDSYLYLPGTNGDYTSCPDSDTLDIADDLDVRVHLTLDDWTPSATRRIIQKYSSSTSFGWIMDVGSTGFLALYVADGTNRTATSGVAIPAVDGQRIWLRATWRKSDGRVQFFTSHDGQTWTQLGTDKTIAAASPTNSSPLMVGTDNASVAGGERRVHRAQVRSGIDGTLVADFDPSRSRQPHRNFIDSVGNVWSINRSSSGRKAVIVDTPMFLFGTDDHMEAPDHNDLDFGAGQDFTVLAAFRNHHSQNFRRLVNKRAPAAGSPGWTLLYYGTEDHTYISVTDTGGVATASPTSVSPDVQRGFTSTVSGRRTSGTLTASVNDKVSTGNTTSGNSSVSSEPVFIGRDGSSGVAYTDMEFIGAAIFRRALTNAEIAKISRHFGWTPYRSLLDEAVVAAVPAVYDQGGAGLVDITGRGHNFRMGSAVGADTNDPLMLPYDGEKYVYLPGVTENYISTPDVNMLDAGTAHMQTSMGKWVGGALSTDFPLFGTNGGKFTLAAGASVFVTSQEGTNGFPVTAGTQYSFQASLRINNARNAALYLAWYDSAGALLSTSETVDRFAISTTGYTEFTHTATAPANAAFARLTVVINDVVDGDILYIGRATLRTGAITTFVPSTRVTGDIDLRAKVAMDDWTPSDYVSLISKRNAANAYQMRIHNGSNGRLAFVWWQDANTVIDQQSSVSVPFMDGKSGWVRATLDVDNGTGVYAVTFYTSTDGNTWTQLGDVRLGTATTSILNTGDPINIGLVSPGNQTQLWTGKVYQTEVRDGIDGPVVAGFNAVNAAEPYTTYTAPNNVVWTFNRSASGRKLTVVDQNLLLFGTDDYAETPDDDELDFGASDSFTALVLARVQGVPDGNDALIAKGDFPASVVGWTMAVRALGGFSTVSDGTNRPLAEGPALSVGERTTYAMVRSVSADTLTTFDDALAGTVRIDTTTGSLASVALLRLGNTSGTSANYLDGEIMGVAIIRRALTTAELTTLANELINYNKSRDKRMLARPTLRPWKE